MSDLVRFLRPRWFRPLLELLVRAPSQSLGAGLSCGYWDLRRGRLPYNIRHGMQVDGLMNDCMTICEYTWETISECMLA